MRYSLPILVSFIHSFPSLFISLSLHIYLYLSLSSSQQSGIRPDTLKKQIAQKGDLGAVAQDCKSRQALLIRPPILDCPGILKVFREIASVGAQNVFIFSDCNQCAFYSFMHSFILHLFTCSSNPVSTLGEEGAHSPSLLCVSRQRNQIPRPYRLILRK